MPDSQTAKVLELMVPGFLHGMGNALFAIQAQAQVLSLAGQGDVDEILNTCGNANAVLDLLRLLAAGDGSPGSAATEAGAPAAAGPMLQGLLDLMRIGLRDTGVTVACSPSTVAAADPVPRELFTRAVALCTAELCAAVPGGCRGDLRISWDGPRVLRLVFVGAPDQLPFVADSGPAAEVVDGLLQAQGGRVTRIDGGVVLTFPEATGG